MQTQQIDVDKALAAWMTAKKNRKNAEQTLLQQGMAGPTVGPALDEALKQRREANRKAGWKRLLMGILALAGGGALTAVSDGGRVFVGLLAVGLVYTLVGLVQGLTGTEAS